MERQTETYLEQSRRALGFRTLVQFWQERDRHLDRQTDRHMDRKIDRQKLTLNKADGFWVFLLLLSAQAVLAGQTQTLRQIDRQTDRQTDIETADRQKLTLNKADGFWISHSCCPLKQFWQDRDRH